MAKITIEIKDNKENPEKSIVTLKVTGQEKASDTENKSLATIYNCVCNALKNLEKE